MKMTSKERALAVFKGELPDRAPVCDFNNTSMLSHYGYVLNDCRANPALVKEIMAKWAKDSWSDLLFGPLEGKGIFFDIPEMEIRLPDDDMGTLKNVFFETAEDLETKILPNPLDAKESPKFHNTLLIFWKLNGKELRMQCLLHGPTELLQSAVTSTGLKNC